MTCERGQYCFRTLTSMLAACPARGAAPLGPSVAHSASQFEIWVRNIMAVTPDVVWHCRGQVRRLLWPPCSPRCRAQAASPMLQIQFHLNAAHDPSSLPHPLLSIQSHVSEIELADLCRRRSCCVMPLPLRLHSALRECAHPLDCSCRFNEQPIVSRDKAWPQQQDPQAVPTLGVAKRWERHLRPATVFWSFRTRPRSPCVPPPHPCRQRLLAPPRPTSLLTSPPLAHARIAHSTLDDGASSIRAAGQWRGCAGATQRQQLAAACRRARACQLARRRRGRCLLHC